MNQTLSRVRSTGLSQIAGPSFRRRWLASRQGALAIAFIAAYVLLDWLVQTYSSGAMAEKPWNPPPGLALACLLIFGLAWTPVLFAASLIAEFVTPDAATSLLHSLVLSAVWTAGFAAQAALLRAGPLAINSRLPRMRDMILLVLSAAAVSFVVAGVMVMLRSPPGGANDWSFLPHLIRQWIGDFIGILVFTPLLLLWWSGRMRFAPRSGDAFAHGFGIFVAALLAFWVVYGARPAEQITSLYLMFLPLIWASLRFGLCGAVVTSLAIQVGVILLSHIGAQSDSTVQQFQIRLLVIAVTALFLGTAVDELHNTEQKLRERQAELDRSLRLAASAELASAMAHELNQPLSAIGLYTRSCEIWMQTRPVPELQETMAKISAEVKRAGDVVHKLREFYRSGGSRLETVSVVTLLRNAVRTEQERALRYGVELIIDEGAHLPSVSVDQVQIGMVLHNLLANSIEAIRDAGSSVRKISLSATMVRDNMVAVTVTDSGPGLSSGDVEQLFRPFSSTKTYGLGLGLSMSRSIVEAHGGHLQFVQGMGGSCFRVTLPVAA